MPRKQTAPKTIISDEPLELDDILAQNPALSPTDDGDPKEEKPYNPIPPRPGEPPPPEPEKPADNVDENANPGENAPSSEPPTEVARNTPPLRPGIEYSAPVASSSPAPQPAVVTYRSRIAIVEAWRYPGQLAEAPSYIDRSWTAWADADLYGRPAGPALRIPVDRSLSGPTPPDGHKIARIGDYVVRQMVAIVDGVEEEAIDVWAKDDFERLFMPETPPSRRTHTSPTPKIKSKAA